VDQGLVHDRERRSSREAFSNRFQQQRVVLIPKHQLLLGSKASIDGRSRDLGGAGDLFDRDPVEPTRFKQFERGFLDPTHRPQAANAPPVDRPARLDSDFHLIVTIIFVRGPPDMGADKTFRERLMEAQRSVPTSRVARLWKTGRGAAGLGAAVLGNRLRGRGTDELDLAAIRSLVTRLGELRGVAMKAGQILGYIDRTLPEEVQQLLSVLQTAAPASPFSSIEEVVRSALGDRASTLLAQMNPTPIAVASIGQVHQARLPDGTEVAVKVRHPGIETALNGDFATAGAGAAFARLVAPGATVTSFIDEARTAILEECDFGLEATRQSTFAGLFRTDETIRVPQVFTHWSAGAVLTSQWLPGASLDAYVAQNPSQADRDRLGAALFRFYVGSLYRHGLFHADPHPGNCGFRDDGSLVIYDFGCVRTYEPATVRALAQMIAAVRLDDPSAMRTALEAFGARVPEDAATAEHVRSLLRGFFAPLLRPGAHRIEISDGLEARQVLKDKRVLMKLELPGRLLFLLRLRFGLYSVLSRLGACVDWAALESGWAQESR
jgi:predicted unusual protein kinase regulating ubiquinone biosynthesis (AarF/ABC1/UbiB family)